MTMSSDAIAAAKIHHERLLELFTDDLRGRGEVALLSRDYLSLTNILCGLRAIAAQDWGQLDDAFCQWEPESFETDEDDYDD
jgi:hypothetical protein